jgi:hypothetical protein
VGKPWTEVEEAQWTKAVWHAVGPWLAGYRWQLYGIVTFAHPPRPETVQKAVTAWLTNMQTHYPKLFAYWSADRGPVSDRWNVHVLLGGLFTTRPPAEPHYGLTLQLAQETAIHLWHRGQVVKFERYGSRKTHRTGRAPPTRREGRISYMTQPQVWGDGEVPGTVFGTPIRKSHGRGNRGPRDNRNPSREGGGQGGGP